VNNDLTRGFDSERIGCLQPKKCEVRPSVFSPLLASHLPRFSHSFTPWSGFLDHRLRRTRMQLTKDASRRQATKLLGMTDGQCANAGRWHPRRLNSLPSSLARLIRNFLRFELACAHLDAAANTRNGYTILTENVTRRSGWTGVTTLHCLLCPGL
jgi:hypothetical protein